jgi:methyltransferase (TIGR00027 family)
MARIRDVTDTALLGAAFFARETARPDALLRDPLAGRLAGWRGEQLARGCGLGWIVRARLIDHMVLREVRRGATVVVNLGAGLDTRPYRLALPPSLHWVEVDLPDLLARKGIRLSYAKPVCRLTRVRLDLRRTRARRCLLTRLGRSGRAIAVTEGLLIYLKPLQVTAIAHELAASGFGAWVVDIASRPAVQLQRIRLGRSLSRAGAPLRFAPRDGVAFLCRQGWRVVAARSVLRTAARLGRLLPGAACRLAAAGLDSRVCLLRRAN